MNNSGALPFATGSKACGRVLIDRRRKVKLKVKMQLVSARQPRDKITLFDNAAGTSFRFASFSEKMMFNV